MEYLVRMISVRFKKFHPCKRSFWHALLSTAASLLVLLIDCRKVRSLKIIYMVTLKFLLWLQIWHQRKKPLNQLNWLDQWALMMLLILYWKQRPSSALCCVCTLGVKPYENPFYKGHNWDTFFESSIHRVAQGVVHNRSHWSVLVCEIFFGHSGTVAERVDTDGELDSSLCVEMLGVLSLSFLYKAPQSRWVGKHEHTVCCLQPFTWYLGTEFWIFFQTACCAEGRKDKIYFSMFPRNLIVILTVFSCMDCVKGFLKNVVHLL